MTTYEINPSAVAGIDRKMPATRPSCGTRSGAVLHRNNREHVCAACRTAENDYMRKRRNTTVARVKELEGLVAELLAGQEVTADGHITIPTDLFVDLYLTASFETMDRADKVLGDERIGAMVRTVDEHRNRK